MCLGLGLGLGVGVGLQPGLGLGLGALKAPFHAASTRAPTRTGVGVSWEHKSYYRPPGKMDSASLGWWRNGPDGFASHFGRQMCLGLGLGLGLR